jgi:hypothetical protein
VIGERCLIEPDEEPMLRHGWGGHEPRQPVERLSHLRARLDVKPPSLGIGRSAIRDPGRHHVLLDVLEGRLDAGVGARALGLVGHTGLGVAIQLIAATLIAPIPLLGATALYFELRQSAATDMPRTDTSPHAPLGDTTPPSTA